MLARKGLIGVFHVAAGAMILGTAAIVYQRVFIFHDSGSYYLYGEHIVSEFHALAKGTRAAIIPLGEAEQDYFGARSPTYSLLTYLVTSTLTLWGVMAVQALAASWVMLTLARAVRFDRYVICFWAAVIGLTLGSSFSYFVSYALPDVFGGLGVLALIGLLVFQDRMSRGERVGLWLLLAAAASFHATFPPVLLSSLAAGGLAAAFLGRWPKPGTLVAFGSVSLAILTGLMAGPLYREAERRVFRHPIEAPPFIMARLLEDGTGVAHLAEDCARDKTYALCHVPIQPPVNSDSFLWNEGEGGVYQVVDPATRHALRKEELRFAAGTVLSRPLEQIAISLRNWRNQLSQSHVFEPLLDPKTQTSYQLFDKKGSRPGVASNFVWEPALQGLRTIVLWTSAAALVVFWLIAARSEAEAEERKKIQVAIVVIVVAVLVNAAICGMLSKPWPRYQARIAWLVPAALLLLSFHPIIARSLGYLAFRESMISGR